MKKLKFLLLALSLVMLTACTSETPIEKVDSSSETTEESVSEQPEAEVKEEESTDATDESNSTQENAMEIFNVGDKVQAGNVVYTVCGTRTSNGSDFFKPSEGNKYLYVDILIENASDIEESISSMLMFSLVDQDGRSYDMTIAGDNNGSVDGSLLPGKRMRGEIVYEVPVDSTEYEIEITPDLMQTGMIIVKLNADEAIEPEYMDLSAFEVPASQLGDTITLGDLDFTLNQITTKATDDLFQPAEGYHYLLAEFTIQNNGSEEAAVSSLMMFSLLNPEGLSYDMALISTNGSLDGSIAPSRKMTGEIAFEVPIDNKAFEMHITDLFNESYFEFELE